MYLPDFDPAIFSVSWFPYEPSSRTQMAYHLVGVGWEVALDDAVLVKCNTGPTTKHNCHWYLINRQSIDCKCVI